MTIALGFFAVSAIFMGVVFFVMYLHIIDLSKCLKQVETKCLDLELQHDNLCALCNNLIDSDG